MNDFPASEEHCRFNFVAMLKKSDDVIFLEFVIVLIRIGSKLHFLNSNVLLVFLRLVKLLILLVEILTVIHYLANRRSCSRRYLYQVQASLFSDLYSLLRRHDSELFILIAYNSNFASSDSLVDPYVFIDGLDLLMPSPWDKRLT